MTEEKSSIRVTKLDNGLTVATDTMPDRASVTLGGWFGVGARHEVAAENGVAHMLEHMMFKGTKNRSSFEISNEMESVGGRMNAYTSRETTAYYGRLLKEDMPLGVNLISDMLKNASLTAEDLDKERHVVLAEIGQSMDSPDDMVFEHFQKTCYPEQGVGRPILGPAEIIKDISKETVTNFKNNYYGHKNLAFIAAGSIEHEEVLEKVTAELEDLPTGKAVPKTQSEYVGGDFRKEQDLEQAHLLFGFEGISYHDDDQHAMAVLSSLLGGGMSSRLFQEVREKRGLVYSVFSYFSCLTDGGVFGVYAGTGEKDVAELVPVVADELNKLQLDVREEEINRAKSQLKAGLLMARESTSGRAEQLAKQIHIYGRPIPISETISKIEAITADDIGRLMKRITSAVPTLAGLGPISGLETYDTYKARYS